MYKRQRHQPGLIQRNESYYAEGLEVKLRKMTEDQEPIKAEVSMIYTDKKDGPLPGYDIRTDRFEIARGAKEKEAKSAIAKSENKGQELDKSNNEIEQNEAPKN